MGRATMKGKLVPFDSSLFQYMTPDSINSCVEDMDLVRNNGIWYKPTSCVMMRDGDWAVVDEVDGGTMSFVCSFTNQTSLKEVINEQLNS